MIEKIVSGVGIETAREAARSPGIGSGGLEVALLLNADVEATVTNGHSLRLVFWIDMDLNSTKTDTIGS